MAVPKKKTSKSRKGNRNSHSRLKPINLVKDQNGNLHLPHKLSPEGTYCGETILKKKKDQNTEAA